VGGSAAGMSLEKAGSADRFKMWCIHVLRYMEKPFQKYFSRFLKQNTCQIVNYQIQDVFLLLFLRWTVSKPHNINKWFDSDELKMNKLMIAQMVFTLC